MKNNQNAMNAWSETADLCRMDSTALRAAYQKRELSPVDVVQAALDCAEKIQAPLNAFTFIDRAGALSSAKESETRWKNGVPLSSIDGIPTTIKDIVDVAGWTVRYGSVTTPDTPARHDAPSVSRLRKAGATFIAQTTTPEYGGKAVTDSPKFGITRNPWDPSRTPGGSSGGAAVAAACGAGVFHLGTDGGGSIRIPASFTGVVGHKPTYGRVAAYPPSSFGTVAHVGPITRTVADAATMLDVMSGRDMRDWTQPPIPFSPVSISNVEWRGKKIGYWKTPCVGDVDKCVANAVELVLKDFEAAGAAIVEIQIPYQDTLLDIYNRHWCVGAANRLASIDPSRYNELDPNFLRTAHIGQSYSAVQRMDAEVSRSRYGAEMDELLSRFDYIVSPTVPILPFEAGVDIPKGSDAQSWIEWCSFSFPINLSQQPACSVPCGFSENGLPIGLQIIGARGDDSSVLSAALSYEVMYPDRFLGTGSQWPQL